MGAIFTSPGRTVSRGRRAAHRHRRRHRRSHRPDDQIDHAWGDLRHALAARDQRRDVDRPAVVPELRAGADHAEHPGREPRAISKFIAPNVLFYFRYGALATVITGLLLAWMQHFIVQALTFQKGFIMIGTGMWMALIMAFNVWFIIWPNQQKILGLVEGDRRAEGRGRQARALCQPLQHHVLDRHALLHGGAAERARSDQRASPAKRGPAGPRFASDERRASARPRPAPTSRPPVMRLRSRACADQQRAQPAGEDRPACLSHDRSPPPGTSRRAAGAVGRIGPGVMNCGKKAP